MKDTAAETGRTSSDDGGQSRGQSLTDAKDVEKATSSEEAKHLRTFLSAEEILRRARNDPEDESIVYLTFAQNDPDNPRNWSKAKKCTLVIGGVSSASNGIAEAFKVSDEVATLPLSMYILGLAFGPLFLAPLSEYWGRNSVWYSSWFGLVIFNIPLALAPNIGTIIVCRFIQGMFGSPPLTNTGGTLSDLWTRHESGGAMAIYGLSSTIGPPLALVISGYFVLEEGWVMLFWFFMAVTGGFWIIILLTLPETRHTTILERKAKKLRKQLRQEGLPYMNVREANADNKQGLHQLFAVTLTRPIRFVLTEPITYCSAIYNGFIFGLIFLFNEAFPLVFGPGGHGFNTGEWGLAFLGLVIGPIIGALLYTSTQERYYLKRVAENGGKSVPEARIWAARYGAVLLPIGLFWFAWTSYPTVHWIVPIIASGVFALGFYIVLLSILSYVIDSYQTYSASALAGVILVRNLVGGGFPLFARQMYKSLGNEWASSLLAFLSILLIAIPWLLFYKGEYIRAKSPWASQHMADTDEDDTPH